MPPSIHDQLHRLGSWHPAMRPNVLENGERGGAETQSIVSEDPLKDSTDCSPADNQESAEPAQKFPILAEDNSKDDQADHSPSYQGSRQGIEEERFEDGLDKEAIIRIVSSRMAEPNNASEDALGVSTQTTREERLLADDLEFTNGPLASPLSTRAEGTLGDRAEMDRFWELEEKDTSSSKEIDFDRTNSFPVVPPPQQTRPTPSQSLPHSQAEVIMEEDIAVSPTIEFSNTASPVQPSDQNWSGFKFLSSLDLGDQGSFANPQSVGGIAATADDEVSRFEEGLPLMSTSRNEKIDSSYGKNVDPEFEGPGASDEEGDFFDKISPQPQASRKNFEPPSLDRKSTDQVLDSIHYPSHIANHRESEALAEGQYMDDPSEIMALPTNVVASQISEQEVDTSDSAIKDGDLAEMWKAALGDDDLLDDNDLSVDPSAFFEDDGAGFLDDDPVQPVPSSTIQPTEFSHEGKQKPGETKSKPAPIRNDYLPKTEPQPMQYTPAGLPMSTPNSLLSAPRGSTEGITQQFYSAQTMARPQMPASTQSFADKSKGGYTSPYDLPMDVSRPKKRALYQQMHPSSDVQQVSSRPPPPRSSSMFAGAPPPADSVPPLPSLPSSYSPTKTRNIVPPAVKASPGVNSFFDELPATKSRPSSSMGRFAPPTSQPVPTPPPPPSREPLRQSSLPQSALPSAAKPSQQYELLPPERMSLYGNNTQAEGTSHVVPAMNARYSPAPNQSANVPPPRNRYAASPSASSRPPPSQTLPFQPRTSSPLAQNHFQPQQRQPNPLTDSIHRQPQIHDKRSLDLQDPAASSFPFPRHQSRDPSGVSSDSDVGITNFTEWRSSPPPLVASQHAALSTSASDSSQAVNTPEPDPLSSSGSPSFQQNKELPAIAPGFPTRDVPRRSQTQSPGAGKYAPQSVSAQIPYQRPASVNQQTSTRSVMPPTNTARPRGRTMSKDINYIRPTDGRELDHLERWKGCPIFSFGFGGAIVRSFPRQIPRYAAGQTIPLIKCSPGEVKLQDGKILPLDDDVAAFPGPLKSKGKKKDVIDWLQRRILMLESNTIAPTTSSNLPDLGRRHEEKILLWKIMRIFIEYDGVLDGNQSAEKAVRAILSPELTQGDTAALPIETSNASTLGITRRNGSSAIPIQANPAAMEDLRKLLLHGEREKAVWNAVDNRLWAHAMLLSSTLDQNIWKQVSQEFVRQEVKTYGENTEALAALFQVFAGNWEESVDELVPPSARAGLQMVSKTASSGPTKNALDGLDRWRETLTLILSNRSSDDVKALMSLGHLLAGYGRIEAAHICYLVGKSPMLFGGPEDPQTAITLIGADHLQSPFDYGRDLDSILLTEIYEFARTILSSSSVGTVSPHLQPFKLYHAMILAEYGYKSEAQQYCEVITSTLNSTTKRSPYYHAILLEALNSLMERLRQAPRDSSGSWISKPSIDKVSGSIWAKFNQYVAGDESDAASTGSGKGHDSVTGPFAGVHGDSPTLSRTPSSNDLYNSYAPGMSSTSTVNASNPRYAPAGLYTPRSSLEQPGRPAQDSQRSAQSDTLRPIAAQQQYQPRPTSSSSSYSEPYKPVAPPSAYPTRTESYLPTPPLQPQYMPNIPHDGTPSTMDQHAAIDGSFQPESQALQEPYQSQLDPVSVNGYESHPASYHAESPAYEPTSNYQYEPPASSSYDPPSYNDNVPLAEESQDQTKSNKKSFMDDDDDDDFEARAAAIRKQDKAQKDREAEEVFRRAAEADGKYLVSSTLFHN